MLTNPSTLGLFEEQIADITDESTRPGRWCTWTAPT